MRALRRLALLVSLAVGGIAGAETSALAGDPSKAECLSSSAEWATLREAHKLRAARGQLLVCAAASCPADIREECSRHIPEVSTAIPSIVFAAQDASGNDLATVAVSMDGQRLATSLDGTSVAIDPGEHTFRFEAAGQTPIEKRLVIREGEKERREKIVFGGGAAPQPAPAPAVQGAPPSPQPAPPRPESPAAAAPAPEGTRSSGLGGQKILGLASGGAGIVGVVVGSVFGLMASSKWSSAKSDCGAGCLPTAPAQKEKSDASDLGTIATIGFVAGGALLATGAALYFTAPASTTEGAALRLTPILGPGTAAMTLSGRF
jgi:hypothetical protein